MSTEESVIRIARNMAWERAKGELKSISASFCPGTCEENQFEEFEVALNTFIRKVENEGLHE